MSQDMMSAVADAWSVYLEQKVSSMDVEVLMAIAIEHIARFGRLMEEELKEYIKNEEEQTNE